MLGLIVALGIVEPRSKIGYAIFRSAYSLPSARSDVLRFYGWSLKEYEGGYVPSSFDDYLTSRLVDCEGTEEESTIIDFQIRQGSARWGDAAFHADQSVQYQIISNIMRRLDSMDYRDAESAMLMVEGLRRGSSIGKGGFHGMSPATLDRAKSKFRIWWGDGQEWPHNRSIDPLVGSGIVVYSGP
jgi:hypothetical protein